MLIALLDKNTERAEQVSQALRARNHDCRSFIREDKLLEQVRQGACKALIIDLQSASPTTLREISGSVPTLLLVEHTEEDALVQALAAGASDYLIKPLRRGELAMRVQIMLRRAYPEQSATEQLHFGPYTFDTHTLRVTLSERPIELTHKEFEVALLLFRNLNRPLSRAYIQEAIWSHDADMPSRTIDTHVSRVRSKLGLRPENGFRLTPVYSYGYRLEQVEHKSGGL